MQDSQTTTAVDSRLDRARMTLRSWLMVCLPALLLYALTANRGTQWQDSGFHILRVITGEALNPLGLALSHPLHHYAARLLVATNLFEPCLAVTLISAIAGAITVANVFGCVMMLTRQRSAAVFAAASLAVAHTFWQMATIAESYTLVAALLSAECWCIAAYAQSRRPVYLLLAGLWNGLGLSNHMLASLTTPVIAIIVLHALIRRNVRMRDVLLCGVLWVVGTIPYTAMIVGEVIRTGDLGGTIHSSLFGHAFAAQVLNVLPDPRNLAISIVFILLSWPNLGLAMAAVGMASATRIGIATMTRRSLLIGLAIHVLFAARYPVIDQHTFFVPSYVFVALWCGIGFAALRAQGERRYARRLVTAAVVLLFCTPMVYAAAAPLARSVNALGSFVRHKPYRDDYTYLLTPWSVVERSADRLARQAVALAGPNGLIIVEDAMAQQAVRYHVIQAHAESIEVVDDASPGTIRSAAANRPVVLVPFDTDAPRTIAPIGVWARKGDLYVLQVEPVE